MDVRCEKCHTEYELEESKVTEAGVTVKCTSCGNLFKIKRRGPQPTGVKPPDLPIDAGAMWLIRSPGGEHRRFRELTTLQQWIVERKVTRECEISRSGETWKRLGEIAELSAFFGIVDQAQSSRPNPEVAAAVVKATMPFSGPSVSPARPQIPKPPLPPPALPIETAATMAAAPAILDRSPEFARTAQVRQRADEVPVTADRPAGGSWAGAMPKAPQSEGYEHGGDDNDPAFAKGAAQTVKVSPGGFGDFSDIDYVPRRRGRGWIFLSALVLVGGAVGVYLLTQSREAPAVAGPSVTPPPSAAPVATTPPPAPTVAPITAAMPDAAAAASPPAVTPAEAALRDGLAKLAEDTDASFAAAEKLLETARVADPTADARAAAALALVASSRAQYLADDAALASDARVAAEARAEATRQLVRAEKLAREAEAKDPRSPEAAVAMADVLRQQKRSAADVEKRLAIAGDTAEAQYVRGMLLWRDGKTTEAQAALEKAIDARVKEGATHLRARYRLAAMSVAAGKTDAAKEQIAGLLEAQPAHARAKALAARLAAPPVAAAPSPPPAAVPGSSSPPAAPAGELGNGPISGNAYTGLVERGDKLAENGDCGSAMRYYDRALDARPGGVEALTGLGYCYLDRKEYARAISSFRAALGISSRYTEALIGIAEAYRFQGMTQEAAGYYRRYLEQAPNGSKAAIARRFVEDQPAPAAPSQPKPPEPTPTAPVTAPPIDRLPDKPGAEHEKPAAPPAENKPAEPATPSGDRLPDKPAAQEPPPEPPPAPRPTDPAAPDSPQR